MRNEISNILVVKRTGKKVKFDKTKVAIAIRKGFESINLEDLNNPIENIDLKINEVLTSVIDEIENRNINQISVEEISDIIEEKLQDNYPEVYEKYHSYRMHRTAARKAFSDEKRLHKFLKSIEKLNQESANIADLKRENANINGDTPMGAMLQFGSTLSKEFAKAYMISPKFANAHEEGLIHIHDMDFLPMGTTTCMQIDIEKLFKDGFNTGHGYLREPNDIMSYSALTAIAIQSNQNNQHGGGGKLWPPYMVTYSEKLCEPYQGCQSYA